MLEDILTDCNQALYESEVYLMEAITSSLEESGNSLIITEKSKESLGQKTKKYFTDIIVALKKLTDSLVVRIDELVRSTTYKAKLLKYREELKQKRSLSLVKVNDVWSLADCYIDMTNELVRYARRMSKNEYRTVAQVDHDIDDFNKIYNTYQDKLEKIYEKKIVINSKAMLDFVDEELSGRGSVIKTLNNSITLLQQMEKECDRLILKADVMGSDIIQKRVGLLKRVGNSISAATKKWSVKIISSMVFIFA